VARGDFSVRANTGSAVVEVAELADNLNLMAKKLSQKETLSSDFVRDVSHEFNTPLSTIEGYASLLQDPCISSEKRDEYSTAIIRAAKKLGALSDNILNLSALEDDHGIANETSFRLDEQVRQTILSLERQWAPKDLELDLFLPTTVYFGHEELLAQVWYNLLANAIKFSSDGGKIGVLIEDGLTNVTVRVSDSGVGMNEQTIERVFEKFFQGDSARKVEGNGLGLALVQRIVALSGGSVEVESQLGYGSTFTVSLPRKAV
jgi:Signal transduction histidine kinase